MSIILYKVVCNVLYKSCKMRLLIHDEFQLSVFTFLFFIFYIQRLFTYVFVSLNQIWCVFVRLAGNLFFVRHPANDLSFLYGEREMNLDYHF